MPTRLGGIFLLVILAALAAGIGYENNSVLALGWLLGMAGGFSLLDARRVLGGLAVRVGTPAPVFAGERSPVTVTLEAGRPVEGLVRLVLFDAGGRRVSDRWVRMAGRDASFRMELAARRRGVGELGAVELVTDRPLGLFECRRRFPARVACIAWPRPRRHEIGGAAPGLPDPAAPADVFAGHRRYAPGDPPQRIDWKAAARGGGLMVKHFVPSAEATEHFDIEALAGLPVEQRLEHLAWQVERASGAGSPYGLALGETVIEPGSGEGHRRRCLSALARYGGGS